MKAISMAVLCAASLTVVAADQSYPNKPIRMIAPAIGGASDIAARLIAQSLSGTLGQQVVVDNRGSIAPEIGAKAAPDGYTLLSYGSPLWLSSFLRDNVPWDPVRDFSPITLTASSPNVLIVHPSLPAKSVRELIALAKARPGELNFSTGSTGALTHLTGELFKAMAGVNIVRIPYKGNGPALNALVGGQVQLMFANSGSVVPQLNSGRLRALAVTSAQPSALVPGLPTVAASGLPGFESVTIIGMFAPAGTPAELIERLNQEIVRVLNRVDVKEKFFRIGVEAVSSSPEQFAAFIKADMTKWGKVIKDAGIRE
ncbi:MAG: tripartite tricarboxylate transporter substrate binding protein [Betaproteobacteria bacterium]|nr:tripartite tricarboxylate transporter substrate binding protein [Betaproteobacteria bacterium]